MRQRRDAAPPPGEPEGDSDSSQDDTPALPATGYQAVDAVLTHCPLKGTQKLVMLGIAKHWPDAWPSVPTLARYAGVARGNAHRALAELQAGDHPWVTIEAGAGMSRPGRGGQRTNRYVIHWARFLPEAEPTARQRDSQPRATATANRAEARGKPALEPALEPAQTVTGTTPPAASSCAIDRRHIVDAANGLRQLLRDYPDHLDALTDAVRGRKRWSHLSGAVDDAMAAVHHAIDGWHAHGHQLNAGPVLRAMDAAAHAVASGGARSPSGAGYVASRSLATELAAGHEGQQVHEDVSARIRGLFPTRATA